MDKIALTASHVKLANQKRKNRRKITLSRAGFVDANGQVFLPPKNLKRVAKWAESYTGV